MKRLTPATLTLFMFGIIGLLVLGYIAKNVFARTEVKKTVSQRDIPVPLSDIEVGTRITEQHLGLLKIDSNRLNEMGDVLISNRAIVGRVTRTPLKAAAPIHANELYQIGEIPPLNVAAGMRAVSVEVGDGVAMVDGMIKPSDYVDVLFTATSNGDIGGTFQGGLTMRLFEGVKVLAINRNYVQSTVDRNSNHVTLEVTEPQQNVIVLARDRGKLTLSYNPNGKGNGGLALSNSERVTLYEIFGLKKEEPVKPKEPFVSEVYRGRGRDAMGFDEKGRPLGGYGGNYGSAAYGASNNKGLPGWDRVGGYRTWDSNGGTGAGGGRYVLPDNNSNGGSNVNPNNSNLGNPGLPAPTINNRQAPQDDARPVPTASLPLPLQN